MQNRVTFFEFPLEIRNGRFGKSNWRREPKAPTSSSPHPSSPPNYSIQSVTKLQHYTRISLHVMGVYQAPTDAPRIQEKCGAGLNELG